MKHLMIIFVVGLLCGRAAASEDSLTITPDVVYGHKAGLAMTFDVIRPAKQNGAAVLFMVSGGWFSFWVPPELFVSAQPPFELHHFRQLVDKGYTVFIVRHGSAPQFKVPDAVADVRRAVRYIRANADQFGIDPERIGVCGGSAGGHLSLMLGTASDEGSNTANDPIERSSDRVAAVVAYFPPVDLRDMLYMKKDFPALDFDPQLAGSVSPLLFVSADDAPTLLVHGDKDDLVKLDHSQRILEAMKKENVACDLVVIEGAGHGFHGEGGQRASKALVGWFDKFLAAEADSRQRTASEAGASVP